MMRRRISLFSPARRHLGDGSPAAEILLPFEREDLAFQKHVTRVTALIYADPGLHHY